MRVTSHIPVDGQLFALHIRRARVLLGNCDRWIERCLSEERPTNASKSNADVLIHAPDTIGQRVRMLSDSQTNRFEISVAELSRETLG